ncbi:hypothetical protein BST81_10245 [Leptolyngbya sp. 'hensonii']|uniref:hypothetical protein n=1 Tax=Leptolyngbya sp. 'hensonii' TaxID=1922337 RepID=UPI00094F811B|nr:hypothetical protein [Leptolyngbya sp. 'hensonii']OLP18466.1 hypothetical protein BST81_10245 [Leptolyngbya sp. 'hensonii']
MNCPACGYPHLRPQGQDPVGNQIFSCPACGETCMAVAEDLEEEAPANSQLERRMRFQPAFPQIRWPAFSRFSGGAFLRALFLILGCMALTTALSYYAAGGFRTYYSPVFHLQAQAMLRGQTALEVPPEWTIDLISFHGQHFLAIPPLNAFLVLPFVALLGVDFPETLFALILYALNLIVLYWTVATVANDRDTLQRSLLFCFLALGTTLFTCAVISSPSFNAVLGSCLFLSAAWLTLYQAQTLPHHLLAILLLAIAATGRWHLALLLPVFILWAWMQPVPRRWAVLAILAVPMGLFLAFVGWWNWARFGNPFQLRYEEHAYGAFFAEEIRKYGFRNLRYILPHLYHGVLAIPRLVPDFPFFVYDDRGNGVLALSPLFAYTLVKRPWDSWDRLAWLCMAIVAIPVFTHFSTGWVQFDYRYFLDFFPFAVFLLLRSSVNPIRWLPLALIALSFWFHGFGVLKLIKGWGM